MSSGAAYSVQMSDPPMPKGSPDKFQPFAKDALVQPGGYRAGFGTGRIALEATTGLQPGCVAVGGRSADRP